MLGCPGRDLAVFAWSHSPWTDYLGVCPSIAVAGQLVSIKTLLRPRTSAYGLSLCIVSSSEGVAEANRAAAESFPILPIE